MIRPERYKRRTRILFPVITPSSFVQADADLLRKVASVDELAYAFPRRWINAVIRVGMNDVVYLWFASTRFLPLAVFAKLLGRQVIIVCGGYDVAAEDSIAYGNMRPGWRRRAGMTLLWLADQVLAMSTFARNEALRNAGVSASKVRTVHLAVPSPTSALATSRLQGSRNRQVCTIGLTNSSSMRRKGIDRFARVSRLLPDVSFVIAGDVSPDAKAALTSLAGHNLRFLGRVSDPEKQRLLRESSLYVQLSVHEAFGVAVAEAMLEGCVPVLTLVGSLPEVGGDAAVYVPSGATDADIAALIAMSLEPSPSQRQAVRDHVLTSFSQERRLEALSEALGIEGDNA